MDAVMNLEHSLGTTVRDVSADKCGWDVTAQPPMTPEGAIPDARHIEVKGRAKGQDTVTVTRNEIVQGLNQGEKFFLAIVLVDGEDFEGPYYVRHPFQTEPDFAVVNWNLEIKPLLSKATSLAGHPAGPLS